MTKEGDKKNIYILRASGEVKRGRKIEYGDCIIVPEKFEFSTPIGTVIKDVAQVLFHLGYTAAMINSFFPAK